MGDAGTDGRISNGYLRNGFEEAVPIAVVRNVVLVRTVRWEHPMPAPFPGGPPGYFPARADGSLS